MRFNMRSFGLGVAMVVPILAGLAVDLTLAEPAKTYCQVKTNVECDIACATVATATCPPPDQVDTYSATKTVSFPYTPCGSKVTLTECPSPLFTVTTCLQYGYGTVLPDGTCGPARCQLNVTYGQSCYAN